nr:pectinesterase family protein [uncultured Bacteroides sp.]
MRNTFIALFALLISTTGSVACFAKTQDADLIVAQDGSGDYRTLQAAINAVPDNSDKRFVIYIKKGKYDQEKLIVPQSKKNLTLRGEERSHTIISYHIYDCKSPETGNKCPAESWALWKDNADLVRTSATLTVMADGCVVENLTVENTAGPVGQALALTLCGNKLIFRNCDILGYQDTVLLRKDGMLNYFLNCLIVGRTDYIYGGGIGYFQSCEIRSWGGGWITAPSTPKNQKYGFVFNQCNFTYMPDSPRPGDDGKPVAIGRPWHNYPKVAILNSVMCEQMHPEGWPTTWHMEYAATSKDLHLYEYNNTGKGADMSGRAKWAGIKELTKKEAKEYTIRRVLGNVERWK